MKSWLESDRFEQICWHWATITKLLIEQGTRIIRFEEILTDFEYFKRNLAEPLELPFSEAQWRKAVSEPVKQTRGVIYRYLYAVLKGKNFSRHSLPPFEEWTDDQKKRFREICGEAADLAGYVI